MANVIISSSMTMDEKLNQMRSDAKFDVSDNDSACIPDLSAVCSIRSKAAQGP